ncbi:MAG TPA: DUF5819 family protein [Oligoflexus sp.]|uniref:DUF5819 family protein n=1 Tax=Oligoflexus sp. TaxID=1971216 RepID=UPI002D80C794|nr:DUF5819 family protein [Oligoflexus sp.]HET9239780.1 DUF5819 family protein [Oligoflexus sp.]
MKYRIAGSLVALLLGFHLLMIATYLGPPNLLQYHIGPLSFRYMQNIFYQNWHLFSPNPGINSVKFAVRCGDANGHWTSWKDPFAGALHRHQLTRITGYSKVIALFDDIAQSLKKDIGKKDKTYTELQETPKQLARRFSVDYCLTRHPERPSRLEAIQFKVMEFSPVPFTKVKDAKLDWDRVVEIPFEPIYRRHSQEVRHDTKIGS